MYCIMVGCSVVDPEKMDPDLIPDFNNDGGPLVRLYPASLKLIRIRFLSGSKYFFLVMAPDPVNINPDPQQKSRN